jgi:hypothetical protein
MKYFIPLLLLSACTTKEMKVTDDIIQGELKIAETVMSDITAIQAQKTRPKVQLVNF